MKIKPIGNNIRIEVKEPKAGGLNLDSFPTAIEYGTVIDLGEDVTLKVKKGDKIFFKAWAVDIITHEGESYYFLADDTKGIKAIVS